ncbi:MAG: KilA-N domain-containing protein [Arcobacteraceae bacterium]|nr:KilA-N domain-containing protein [Arcobacteraceae bacterium]
MAVLAHSDIAFEFGMWISAEFKIYLIKEFQRLKDKEQEQISFVYSNEADILNVALFGMTAKQWRENNTNKKVERYLLDTNKSIK